VRWLLLAVLFLLLPARASATHWLIFTLPSTGQHVWYEAYPDEPTADSLHIECDGGPYIHGLETVYLWGYRPGGFWAVVDSHMVMGREGQVDSFPAPFAGGFYITARNNVGMSCESNLATVLPDTLVTGISDHVDIVKDWVVSVRLYDVRGRRIYRPVRGPYWVREIWHSGRIINRRGDRAIQK
jgi:hypothetical protein